MPEEYVTLTFPESDYTGAQSTPKAHAIAVHPKKGGLRIVYFARSQCRLKAKGQIEVPVWLMDKIEAEHGSLLNVQ